MVNNSDRRQQSMQQNDRRSYPVSTRSSVSQWNSIPQFGNRSTIIPDKQISYNSQQITSRQKQINHQQTLTDKFSNCKICNRTNHRTIDCFHKRTTGCFKCGQTNRGVSQVSEQGGRTRFFFLFYDQKTKFLKAGGA
jgi:hypothetical protein